MSKRTNMRLSAWIAWRMVRSRRSATISLVTWISILGVAFGVLALTVLLAVTGGFQQAFEERILGLQPHIVVHKRGTNFREYQWLVERIRDVEGVAGASPSTWDEMMMAAGNRRAGAGIKGWDIDSVSTVLDPEKLITEGSIEDLAESPTVRVDGDDLVLEGVVEGTWLTVVLRDEAPPLVLLDDRTPPDAGNTRVTTIDLRPDGAGQAPRLDPGERPDRPDELVPPREVMLAQTVGGGQSSAREVKAGSWVLTTTDERLELQSEQLTTLVLLPAGREDGMRSMLLSEPARITIPERRAMVRVVDGRSSGAARTLRGAAGDVTAMSTSPGEHSNYSPTRARHSGILLGVELARRLEVSVGDEVSLVTPLRGVDNKMLGPYGMAPSSVHLTVVGLFESGYYEYDVRLGLMNIVAAQRFMNRGDVIKWIDVRTTSLLDLAEVKRRLGAAIDPYELSDLVTHMSAFDDRIDRMMAGEVGGMELNEDQTYLAGVQNALRMLDVLKYQASDIGHDPDYTLRDWQEMNINLFSALQLQKIVLTMVLMIIIIVASFVMVGSQIMVIHEKTAEIAILKAMGVTPTLIRIVFTLQGLMVAVVGTLLGLTVSVATVWLLEVVDYELEAAVYLIDHLPVEINPLEWVMVVAMALGSMALATQYSAGRAAAMTPVAGLRAVD